MTIFVQIFFTMIQRIQTVYFLVALSLISISLLTGTFFTFGINSTHYAITSTQTHLISTTSERLSTNYFWIIQSIQGLLLVFTIFLFKNRKRQLSLAWLALVLNGAANAWIIYAAWMQYIAYTRLHHFEESIAAIFRIELAFYLQVGAFLLMLLGIRGIRKDKKLIDSLNRLR